MPNPGDKVKLVTKQETVEGMLMPSFQKGVTLIKLDNGYNVGLAKKITGQNLYGFVTKYM